MLAFGKAPATDRSVPRDRIALRCHPQTFIAFCFDTSQPKRGFRDKEEWKCVLSRLEEAGKLAYLVESDEIQVAATGAGSESDSDAA